MTKGKREEEEEEEGGREGRREGLRMSKRHRQSPKLKRRETEAHGLEGPSQKTHSALGEGQPGE